MIRTPFFAALVLLAGAARAERRILVCADAAASPETLSARDALVESGAPLLRALVATQHASAPESAPAPVRREAWRAQGLDHIVLLGTADEGAAAAKTAGTTYGVDTSRRELFRLGLGRFRGDVGFVETRPNPWLWSDRFDDNPFTTLLVRIGGTTPRGVALAAAAFANGMNNGVVLGDGASRVETSILDRDPSPDPPPPFLPRAARAGEPVYAGWSQPAEMEARAFLDWGAGKEPEALWRIKFLAPDALETGSGAAWTLGPSALAWGNAALLARFADPADPPRVLAALRNAPGATSPEEPGRVCLPMPADESNPALPGSVTAWADGNWIVISTLPDEVVFGQSSTTMLPQPKETTR